MEAFALFLIFLITNEACQNFAVCEALAPVTLNLLISLERGKQDHHSPN